MNEQTEKMYIEEWIDILRSDSYEQRERPQTERDSYCLLGYAMSVYESQHTTKPLTRFERIKRSFNEMTWRMRRAFEILRNGETE